jgi:photosystem II stability/assembly factor-like uncharacterized protein
MMKTRIISLNVVLFLSSCNVWGVEASSTKASDSLNVKVAETVLITKSRAYCWFPNVCKLWTGELIVTLGMAPDATDPEGNLGGASAFCVSKDGGKTWSRRVLEGPLFSAAQRDPESDGSMMGLSFHLFPSDLGGTNVFETTLTEISDHAQVITHRSGIRVSLPEAPETTRVEQSSGGGRTTEVPDMVFHGSILDSLDGGLLASMYGTFQGEKSSRVILAQSRDKGRTWSYLSTIAQAKERWPGMGNDGACEPGIVRLADGRLFCIMRTGSDGLMYQTWSADDGKSWEKPVPSGVKGVDPQLRLMENGVLACSYGRPGPVTLMFSRDGTGKTWSNITPIFNEMSTRYTGLIEVAPNRLLLVYDHVPYGWKPIPQQDRQSFNEIYGTFVMVNKIP